VKCRECGAGIEAWHHILLCDRCLGARNWSALDGDDYVLIRRERGGTGRVWLSSNHNGDLHTTDLTALRLDPLGEVARRVSEVFDA
jgi:hypothetical protein